MIKPALQGEAFLADVRDAASSQDDLHIWWLGQSGFLVQWRGSHLLFDPYLSDSLSRKYAATDKPHARMTEQVIAPDALDFIDLTTSSHNHTDHLDAETLQEIHAENPGVTLVLATANVDFAEDRLGENCPCLLPVDAGETVTSNGFSITAIPAAHDEIQLDAKGRSYFLGFVAKFGPWAIYHSGDTRWHDKLVPSLLPHSVDLALVPINGYKPERRVAGNLLGVVPQSVVVFCRDPQVRILQCLCGGSDDVFDLAGVEQALTVQVVDQRKGAGGSDHRRARSVSLNCIHGHRILY